MIILPAIDLFQGKAVRLYKGDYSQMTVYSNDPLEIVRDFERCGSEYIHIVDLEGAKDGTLANYDTISDIVSNTTLKVEVGGGIRSEEAVRRYLDIGVDRVILGTSIITDWDFFSGMADKYKEHIAAGVDLRDGYVAIKGWKETSSVSCFELCEKLSRTGADTLICTDISKDGAMSGTNRALYRELAALFSLKLIASGGISDMSDIVALKDLGLYGAIIGKAYYTKALDLQEVIENTK